MGSILDSIYVMAELEDFLEMKAYENEDEQRLVKEEERAEEKEKTAKEAGRREATGRSGLRRKELTKYRRTFK